MQILQTCIVQQMGQEALKIYIARTDDLDAIVSTGHEEFLFIDVLRSPVIEFSRCYMGEGRISDGRFYALAR